jgi:hypothetical protein
MSACVALKRGQHIVPERSGNGGPRSCGIYQRPRPGTVARSVPHTGCLTRSMAQSYVMVAGGGTLVKADSSGDQVDAMRTRRWFLALPPACVLPAGYRTAAGAVALPWPVRSSCGQTLRHRRPRPASAGRDSTHTTPGIPRNATVTGCYRRDSYPRAAACLLTYLRAEAQRRGVVPVGQHRSCHSSSPSYQTIAPPSASASCEGLEDLSDARIHLRTCRRRRLTCITVACTQQMVDNASCRS